MTAPAQRSTCIGALPSNAYRSFPLDRTVFGMLKPMAYHLSPAVDSTMVGERPPPTRRNFSAASEGPTSRLARRNPGQAFWTIPCSGTSLDRFSSYRLLLSRGGRAVQSHTPGSAATSPVSCCHKRMRAAMSRTRSRWAGSSNRLFCSYGSERRSNNSPWSPAHRNEGYSVPRMSARRGSKTALNLGRRSSIQTLVSSSLSGESLMDPSLRTLIVE